MTGTYSIPLVILSYLVACLASYTTLVLGRYLANDQSKTCKWAHVGGAFALGAGIWAMHFVGMLAYQMEIETTYDPLLTFLSFLIATVTSYGMLAMIKHRNPPARTVLAAGTLLGFGICGMHYIGMAGMRMNADLLYVPHLFILSILAATGFSAAALWISYKLPVKRPFRRAAMGMAALVLGAAICSMHYMGMEAAIFVPHGTMQPFYDRSFQVFAIFIASVAGLILGTTLIFSLSRKNAATAEEAQEVIFPVRALTLSAFLTFGAMAWITSYSLYSDQVLKTTIQEDTAVDDISGNLTYIDDTLMQAVRKATVMGDPVWEQKYRDTVQNLRHSLDIVRKTFKDGDTRYYADAITAIQAQQAVIEDNVFALVREGRLQEARAALETNAYIQGQYEYAERLKRLANFLQVRSSRRLASVSHNLNGIAYVVMAAAMALFIAWFFSLRSLSHWRKELQNARAHADLVTEKLGEEKARLQTIMDNITKGIVTIDPGGIIQSVNAGTEIIFGHAGRDLIGTSITSIIPAIGAKLNQDSPATRTIRLATLIDRHQEMMGIRKNGEPFPLTIYVRTITQNGKMLCICFLSDITEQKHREADLEREKERAESASAAKSDFLANMSHELRTPLNSIIGMTRLLQESNLEKEHHDLVDLVYRSSTNLLEIVNDILDLSKIEANEIQLEHIGFDVLYVADSVLETLAHIAKEKRLSVTKDFGIQAPPYILGDPTRFSRILVNLISNAIKYTDQGGISVQIGFQNIDPRHISLECRITDTGIGIAQDKLKSIFDKFVQADSSTTRKYGGTGLGLAITKQLIELMGGSIRVESQLGKGSTFNFMIPFEISGILTAVKRSRRSKKLVGTLPAADAKVLIAEDHPLNQALIRKLLERMGIRQYTIVDNGIDAVQAYRDIRPDIVLMDCHMPGQNGYDATKDIRTLEKQVDRYVPIVAMTANAMVGDREKCLRYGMNDYISKPIDSDEMKDILGQWICFPGGRESNGAAAPMRESRLDLSQLRTFTNGDKEAEKELIGMFVRQSDQNLRVLARLETSAEPQEWSEAAHMFKGGAAGIGADTLRSLCDEAQHCAGSLQEKQELYDKIRDEYMSVKNTLYQEGLLD